MYQSYYFDFIKRLLIVSERNNLSKIDCSISIRFSQVLPYDILPCLLQTIYVRYKKCQNKKGDLSSLGAFISNFQLRNIFLPSTYMHMYVMAQKIFMVTECIYSASIYPGEFMNLFSIFFQLFCVILQLWVLIRIPSISAKV